MSHKPADMSEHQSIFKWNTVLEIAPHELHFQGMPVPGMMISIELTSDVTVHVWRADDRRQYFCHGLTFGGKDAPGGALSPYTGDPVDTILRQHFEFIGESESRPGDILVWLGVGPETTPHSATLTDPIVAPATNFLDYSTRLRTKNGLWPETNMTLEKLIRIYGESYKTYRRRWQ
jgi:hypothetical protein